MLFLLQELAQPDAPRILELEEMFNGKQHFNMNNEVLFVSWLLL